MKKIEKISKVIDEKIVSSFWTRLIDWYKIKELRKEELYEIRLYANFTITDEQRIDRFRNDMERLVKEIEDNTLLKIDDDYYIIVINKINLMDSTLEIVLISEKITNRKDGKA